MKIAFYSNFLTHQQVPFCREILNITGMEFYFVANEPIPKERLSLGYADMNAAYDFVIRPYFDDEQRQFAQELADTADVVIIGSSSMHYFKNRFKQKKLTFRYTERLFKNTEFGINLLKTCLFTIKANAFHKMSLLAASAFAAADYAKIGLFKNRVYKWGYFTEVEFHENIGELIAKKQPNSLLWAGRLIDVKHPFHAIDVAQRLKKDGVTFTLDIIGNGPLEQSLKQKIIEQGLEDCVFMRGSMKPEQVREYMDKAEIYLFTSDKGEGWGTVLNEAMNSGCAVVASHAIGSVPFLAKHAENSLIYADGNVDDLYQKTRLLLTNPAQRQSIATNAYHTMIEDWNPKTAATRFVALSQAMLAGNSSVCYQSGPCSKAETLKNNWFLKRKSK